MKAITFPSAREIALRSVKRDIEAVARRVEKSPRFSDLLLLIVLADELTAVSQVRP